MLNKPSDYYTLKHLVSELKSDFVVYVGGPVEQNNLYFIHEIPRLIPESVETSSWCIYWGGNYNAVKILLEKSLINDNDITFLSRV